MGDEVSLPLGMAMYDLMGKAAGVPVYKLFGQKHRSWVPVSSWTVSTHPEHMAEAGASRGSGAANPVALGHRFHLRRRHTHVLPLRAGEIRTLPRVSRLEAGLGALQPLRADYDPLLGRRGAPEFTRMYDRLEREGIILEPSGA